MTNKKKLCWMLVSAALAWNLLAGPSLAIMQFQKQFWAVYLENNNNEEFVVLVKKKAKCNVCHDPTKRDEDGKPSKKFRNIYGQQLAKLLDRKKDKKDTEKIRKVLAEVAKMKSDPKDPQSPTFGALIEQGKLPAGLPKSDETEPDEAPEQEEAPEQDEAPE
ncbi:MAG: hypothetical protein A2W31_13965 [Planctomycetes bacterium RBG_16_64_10]|nr:MAG: hypothetical protein A2W31_13965 [Planctomycetes bacterium RBG_16_64_10]